MTDELRALLRAELDQQRPPPLGDVVATAVREGRRIRRRRRLVGAGAAGALVLVAAAAAVVVSTGGTGFGVAGPDGGQVAAAPAGGSGSVGPASGVAARPGSTLPPGSVPTASVPPATAAATRTVAVRNGTQRAGGMQKKATSAAMLHLLTTLLPPGRTSHYAVAPDNDLHVQLYYDAGAGPSMLEVAVDRTPASGPRPARGDIAQVTIAHTPDDCVRDTEVSAVWPDGTTVQLDVGSCLAFDGVRRAPARPQLSEAVAVMIAGDARWGVMMDAVLVRQGAQQFPRALPVFAP